MPNLELRTRLARRATLHWVAGVCAVSLVLSGCSTQMLLSREEIEPGKVYEGTNVLTYDGLEYRFERVIASQDSLVGEYTVEVQRQNAQYGIYYEDVTRTQTVALDRVEALTLGKRDAGKTFFFGAGVAAVGFFVKELAETAAEAGGGGGSKNKPDPNG